MDQDIDPTKTPAGPPPPGVTPDFNAPLPLGSKFIGLNVFLMAFALVFLLARLWTRLAITKTFDTDDGLIVFAYACGVALTAVSFYMMRFGMCQHIWNIPLSDLVPHYLKFQMITTILYCVAMGTTKLSILLFYLRIFPGKAFRYCVFVIMFIAVGFSGGSAFSALFACQPIKKTWYPSLPGSCINVNAMYYAFAGLGIATDILTLVVPLPQVWKLQLPLRQKVILGGLLVMGTLVCIVSIIRLKSIHTLTSTTDMTYNTTDAMIWSVLEVDLGIAGGCAPTLRPFLRHYFPRLLGTEGPGTGQSGPGPYSYGRSTRRPYQSHQLSSLNSSRAHGKELSDHKGGFTSTVTGGKGESQEHIVQPNGNSQIVKTVEYDLRVGNGRA